MMISRRPFVTRLLTVLVLVWCLPLDLAAQTTVAVNTTDDLDDGTCDATHCSLREAITASNNAADGGIITFNIPGSGPHTIQPSSALPPLEDGVLIDGATQPGFAGAPVIELDGSLAGEAHGLDVVGSNNLIRALVINRFAWNGISINTDCTDNVIEGSYIGTDVSGMLARGNSVGVLIGQAQRNTVGGAPPGSGNVISGNQEGVTIVDVTATDNVVIGNYIGTDVTGTSAIPNGIGVLLLAPNNRLGGPTVGARNVISGNQFNGVDLGPPNATGNVIEGNYIGVDATGTAVLGNDIGVFVNDVANNTIGGTEEGAGNLVSGNVGGGLAIAGEFARDNTVVGNLIGTDATGTAALGNVEAGVALLQGASENTIGGSEPGAGNVLSGNVFGVLIADSTGSGNQILGNLIGTDAAGNQAIPNFQTGILLWGTNNVIGGVEAGARNVISGNGFAGIDLGPGSTGTMIRGNYIGTNSAGTAVLGNDLGIFVNFSPNNVIGGTEPGAGNVISGNLGLNININGLDASENTLQGNYIGTDATGTVALPTGRALLIQDAPNNLIGGTQPGARNVISGNYLGISIEGPTATENVIAGNYIGVDVTGSAPLGNRGAGIRFTTEASDNTVGGTEPGAGNIIANSSWVGIAVFPEAGTGNRILGNSIFDNAQLGIELNRDGVTLNDEDDSDTGPNNLQNFPTLIAAAASSSGAVIEAELVSAPDSAFLVDFFSNLACDEEGHGEGRTPLGGVTLSTDATGMGSIVADFSTISGTVLTATATDADGNTSEFSQCMELATWGVSASPTSRTVTQGQSASYTISVSAEGGTFDETVSLSCSGAPPEATCTFDQGEITLVDGQSSATMTVTTAAPTGSSRMIPWTHRTPPWTWLGVALLLLVGMGLWKWFGRSAIVPVQRAAIAALVGLMVLLQNSCGTDGTSPPEGGTPTGTYELTITAAWESAQSTSTVALVVE